MQGKESPKPKARSKSSAGIDVCKNWLDAHIVPEGCSLHVPNNVQGWRQLKRWLAKYDIGLVAIEATGKWHRPVHRSLHAGGFSVAIVNPLRARLFAEAIGMLAKSDCVDARMLALLAQSLSPSATAPAPHCIEALQELVAARSSATGEHTALQNQLASATIIFLRTQLKHRIDRLTKDITGLDAEIGKRIAADQGLARRYEILLSIPGLGSVTAATLVADLAELGTCNAKQIAMLAGLAPLADDSGSREGNRAIRAGRAPVRRVLYLCALSATRCNASMKAVYRRLTAAGKPPKVALVAIARKLLILANTLINQDRTWQPLAPSCP